MKPRRLKGHKASATCCIASRARPGLIASSAEDGCICWFDLRCKDPIFMIEAGSDPISSLCFKAGNEDVLYVSAGTKITCYDIHMGSSWKPLVTYNYNKEEINQIAFTSKSYFLAAADDSGDVKIIDTRQQCLYKTLRAAHTSICSSVQFLPWKPWTVVTGGLDTKFVMWDFSKGRPYHVINYGVPEQDNDTGSNSEQCFNPPFVHSIAVIEDDIPDGLKEVCAVARGDGIVDIIDIESEITMKKSKNSSQSKRTSRFGSRSIDIQTEKNRTVPQGHEKRLQLDYNLGGHTAAVSCVSFSLFGEKGKFLISGGNDASVKLWDWSKHFQAEQTSCNSNLLLNINVNKKVNWLCTAPIDTENLIVCDTSKVLKVYSVP